ncbi:hypothetical protein C5748_17065 [Phyllobacterium phragmitis]|uniref:Uncharacterized protein n=1 Tax=Phyllobacterium phragmitis TaxID=2670329 RepID=A0A2S9INS6_9HYPH|nr:hypothetical protein C5748_17065 [Phyllobacterium phragmitis]
MPWVRFIERFRWSPPEFNNTWTKVFPAGYVGLVPTRCANAAVEAGKAERTQRPRTINGTENKSTRA